MNVEAKHTPGPWGTNGSHIYAPDGAIIAMVNNPGSKAADYSLVANRDLMAAAPDMLAALQAFNLKEEWIVSGSADSLTLRIPLAVLQQAVEAVSKAVQS